MADRCDAAFEIEVARISLTASIRIPTLKGALFRGSARVMAHAEDVGDHRRARSRLRRVVATTIVVQAAVFVRAARAGRPAGVHALGVRLAFCPVRATHEVLGADHRQICVTAHHAGVFAVPAIVVSPTSLPAICEA